MSNLLCCHIGETQFSHLLCPYDNVCFNVSVNSNRLDWTVVKQSEEAATITIYTMSLKQGTKHQMAQEDSQQIKPPHTTFNKYLTTLTL